MTSNPEVVIAIRVDNYPVGASGSYEPRFLDLNVYRGNGQTLIWRGTASGSIDTDSVCSDLSNAVRSILTAVPPS